MSTKKRPEARSRAEQALKDFHEEGAFGRAYDGRLLRRIWQWVAPYQRLIWVALVATLLTAGSSLVRPLIIRYAMDEGVSHRNVDALVQGGLTLGLVLVVEQALVFAQVYALQVAGARAIADLRRGVFRFLHERRMAFFDSQPVGRLVTRVTNDTDVILELFASGVVGAVGDLVRLVGIVALMVSLEPRLAAITFAGLPPIALLLVVLRRYMREAFRDIRAKTARMNATMNEQVSGITVVQAFRREAATQQEFDQINIGYREANLRAIKYEAMQDAAIELVAAVCVASMLVYVGYSPVSFGTLVAFNVYVAQFFEPIGLLSQRYTLLQSAMAGAERVFALLDIDERDAPTPAAAAAPSAVLAPGSDGPTPPLLSLSQVTFEYKPGTPVLSDISFNVTRGEKIALVGPTGSGKSTILSLLLRLYEVEQGAIQVEGKDVKTFPRDVLRRKFAVVPQDVFLFPGSLASNVAFSETPDLERVKEVLSRIGALDLFLRRAEGLEARVEERGANFSAGERQLIAFARALYRDAEILVLDEATASIDSDTEARLQNALGELVKSRTAIVIAHRLATIRAADRILVLRNGRIVEQGSHDQLIEQGGLYARLYSLQSEVEHQHLAPAVGQEAGVASAVS